jgi:uncharacterized protein YdhG (YjbR/CyaY superfamily)
MVIHSDSVEDYIRQVPDERKEAVSRLRTIFLENLPGGFAEVISYNMIGYVVPHTIYPAGYHCDPKLPLPFLALASQKHFIAVYHMGLYTDDVLLAWFTKAYADLNIGKLDMGKSCIRFKNMNRIPFGLFEELAKKMSAEAWIHQYETVIKKS